MAAATIAGDAVRYEQVQPLALPSGMLFDYAGGAAPTGFLLCDGSAVSRATYATLFAAIGTTWGAGDGSTTFNVPDIRGRATIGAGTGTGLSARAVGTQNIGEETHVLTTAELAAHNHTITDSGHVHSINDPGHFHSTLLAVTGGVTANTLAANRGDGNNNNGTSNTQTVFTGINATNSGVANVTSANNGSGTAHNNMQPSAVVLKIIKT